MADWTNDLVVNPTGGMDQSRGATPMDSFGDVNPGPDEYRGSGPGFSHSTNGTSIPMNNLNNGTTAYNNTLVENSHGVNSFNHRPSDDSVFQEQDVSGMNIVRELPSRRETTSVLRRRTVRRSTRHGSRTLQRTDQPQSEQFFDGEGGGDDNESAEYTTFRAHGGASVGGRISERREMRIQEQQMQQQQQRTISKWKEFKWQLSLKWKAFKEHFENIRYYLSLWRSSIKAIEGRFGTGVVSYFIFLRWLVLLNILLAAEMFFFVFLPQVIKGERTNTLENSTTEWYTRVQSTFTGQGYLHDTELFYGVYTNNTLGSGTGYKMPYAYLITVFVVFLSSVVVLVSSMATAYRKSYVQGTSGLYSYSNKTFSAWDFSITDMSTAQQKAISIKKDFEEEIQTEKALSEIWELEKLLRAFGRRVVVNTAIIVMYVIAGVCIYFATVASVEAVEDRRKQTAQGEELSYSESVRFFFRELAAPLVIAAFDLLFPTLFQILSLQEMWRTPRTETQLTLIRTVLLRLSSLGVLMVSIFVEIRGCTRKEITNANQCTRACWETFAGQKIYQLVIIDFVVVVVATLLGETLWKILFKKSEMVANVVGPPEFFIAKSVLELLYAQALLWLGVYYAPLLPIVCIIKLILFFYTKKFSLLRNLKPSARPYRASRQSNIFQLLLLLTLFLTLIPVGYTVVQLTPSRQCGPFRHADSSAYDIVPDLVNGAPKGVEQFFQFLGSAAFLGPLLLFLVLLLYYYRALAKAQKHNIFLLKEQLQLEGKDKQFLLSKVRRMQSQLAQNA